MNEPDFDALKKLAAKSAEISNDALAELTGRQFEELVKFIREQGGEVLICDQARECYLNKRPPGFSKDAAENKPPLDSVPSSA